MASSLETNKLLAGVLTAGIIAVGAGVFSGILYRPQPLPQHAFSVVVEEPDVADAAAAPDEPPLAVLLASADPAAGQTITRQCTACHVFEAGGDNRVGPYLWDVVGRDIASVAGFNYSAALQEIDGEWTYEALDGFLANPRGWAPGTSMSYAGLRSATDRANLIAYLREQSDDPQPLPEPDMAEEAAPAEEPVAVAEEPAPAEEPVAVAEEEAPAEEPVAIAEEPVPAEEPVVVVEEEAPTEEAVVVVEEATPAAEEPVAAVEEEPAPADEPVVAAAEEPAPAEEPAAPTNGEMSPMVAMVAEADPAAGQASFRQCAACHTVDEGGQNRVGPNLWDVFGADIGHHDGFNYSQALLALEGIWTVDKLDAYLENPRAAAPGNRMAFAGLRSAEDRAAMIAYLRSLSDDPKPVDIQ
jgi:cytochrome c